MSLTLPKFARTASTTSCQRPNRYRPKCTCRQTSEVGLINGPTSSTAVTDSVNFSVRLYRPTPQCVRRTFARTDHAYLPATSGVNTGNRVHNLHEWIMRRLSYRCWRVTVQFKIRFRSRDAVVIAAMSGIHLYYICCPLARVSCWWLVPLAGRRGLLYADWENTSCNLDL